MASNCTSKAACASGDTGIHHQRKRRRGNGIRNFHSLKENRFHKAFKRKIAPRNPVGVAGCLSDHGLTAASSGRFLTYTSPRVVIPAFSASALSTEASSSLLSKRKLVTPETRVSGSLYWSVR